jgi:hypothetical protein
MVTDALWVDLNNDNREDLVVVGEWMPVTVFHNENGKFVEVTRNYGLQDTRGWWNTVAAADVNHDRFIDLVVGNLGLNAVLKTSQDRPVQLFIHDFSGDGKPEQILTYYHGEKSYPLAAPELMFSHFPALRKKYSTYTDYAGKPLQKIFPAEQLQAATVRTAMEFASLLLMNQGGETFQRVQLPAEAQFSPIYAILIDDFNQDGNQDMLLGGNFYGAPPEQGRYDASYGSLLLGDGKGTFAPASLQASGFIVSGEVRAIKPLQTVSAALIMVARNHGTVATFQRLKHPIKISNAK